MRNKIQIVCFDNPSPANYGGAIDMFYKIKALHALGIRIDLHIFYTTNNTITELQAYADTIFLYQRQTSAFHHLSIIPFSVKTRQSRTLVRRLNHCNAPVFVESLRCSALLSTSQLSVPIYVRCHNIEHAYSFGLSKSSRSVVHKLAHYIEGVKQRYFEKNLRYATVLFPISYVETEYFKTNYNVKTIYLPVFHGFRRILSKPGIGEYTLYHGDLSTADNVRSVLYIIETFKTLNTPLIITSRTSTISVLNAIKPYSHITFIENKTNSDLQQLIENAHINVMYSFQKSGTKLKVFNALYNGRHCLINTNMIDDDLVKNICEIAETKQELREQVLRLFNTPYVLSKQRKNVLTTYYNDIENAKIIVSQLV